MLDDFILIALCICVGCFILAMFYKQVLDQVFINYFLESPANRDWENSSGAFSIAGSVADTPSSIGVLTLVYILITLGLQVV